MNRLVAERTIPKAIIKKARTAWLFWLIPLGAAALCVWFVYRDYIASGPLITIYFQNVEGVMPGNTQIQYRGSQIGEVKTVALAPDLKSVKVTSRLARDAKNLAREGSVFWVVRPEVKVGTISGLQTIVSGVYINVQPGQGSPTNVFLGSESQPVERLPDPLNITIRSSSLDSMQETSPVFYRGIQVGEVTGYQLAPDGHAVLIRARIRHDYAPLVRENSVFWNAGGVDFHIGLFKGAEISAESAESLLGGGVAFATPPDPGAPAADGALFDLSEKSKDEWKKWAPSIPLQLPVQAPAVAPPPGPRPHFK
ncbi:MAG TPA: MlaD family protein [Verrucomicrobiae bacterium]|jgi:paraquat-inducible protein B|nr:MlaD family protein [Verrucomicrobiae bacterium]